MSRSQGAWPWWRWALTGLSALALALSAYLSWHYLQAGPAIGCGAGSPCDPVLRSRWAAIGGILPVSGLAAGAYLGMLIASLSIGPGSEAQVRRLAWGAMLVLVGAAAGSAVWFTILQKWVIGAFCPLCMANHITGLVLAALVVWRAPRRFGNSGDVRLMDSSSAAGLVPAPIRNVSPTTPRRLVSRLPAMTLIVVGMILAVILAICQVAFAPSVIYRQGESRVEPLALDPHAMPLLGSPEAPYIVDLLFDYKCPHCQQLHFMLNEAIRRYGGKLAFALCPAPLNRQCNPYIPRDVDEFKDSCELAKVGLTVWVANRAAFAAFDNWMFSFESGDRWQPRNLEAARAKAVELVGQSNFDAASTNVWIDGHMQTSVRIYADTLRNGNGAIPKLVFGPHWVIPEPNDANDLVLILQNSLAVPKP